MDDKGLKDILYSLGAIEASITDLKIQLSNLPCGTNTERLIKLEQSFMNGKELKKELENKNKEHIETKFKSNGQILSIIALVISSIIALLNIYTTLFRR